MSSESVSEQKRIQEAADKKNDHSRSRKREVETPAHPLQELQRTVGNRGVQRLLAQRKGGDGLFEVDDEIAGRISRERGGGQPVDSAVAARMTEATGSDLSGVRVHASAEAADLSRALEAKAFTTGQDIFFGDGAYQPGSTGGQELLAHELTHVVQQASGAVGGGDRMTVNAPGDRFEQQADAVARQVFQPGAAEIQRQPEEEASLQRQEMDEDDEEWAA